MATYTITELAREFDITPRAIRFYEDQGLISPRREGTGGRIRIYGARDRTRLKLTLQREDIEVTLAEIAAHEEKCRRMLAEPLADRKPAVSATRARRAA